MHVQSAVFNSLNTMDCSPPSSSVHGIFQARILEWVAVLLLQGIFLTQGLNLCLLHWQVDSLPSEPPGKPEFISNRAKKERQKLSPWLSDS